MTNGDRIRQMSDEELAETRIFLDDDIWCDNRCMTTMIFDSINCNKCKLRWLKEEIPDE